MNIAVGFDFDRTLAVDHSIERTIGMEILMELARESGHALGDEDAARMVEEALNAFRSQRVQLNQALRACFKQYTVDDEQAAAAVARFRALTLECVPAFVEPLPGARECLAALDKAGIPYALLTNGWSPLQEEKARVFGFTGAVFVSDVIEAWKPSPRAFAALPAHFALLPEQVWYVGDNPVVDIEGARRAGLVSVWMDWEYRSYPDVLLPPDYRVHDFDALSVLLGQGHLRSATKRPS